MTLLSLRRLACALLLTAMTVAIGYAAQTPTITVNEAHKKIDCATCHTKDLKTAPAMSVCLGCHGGSYAAVAKMTADMPVNPHDSHKGDQNCSACHAVHKPGRLSCNDCHSFSQFKLK